MKATRFSSIAREGRVRQVPVEQLTVAIEALLRAGPRVIDAIARELGYSVAAVRPRLEQLQLDGRAYRVRVRFTDWPGMCYCWHAGAAIDAPVEQVVVTPERAAQQRLGMPLQATVRTYPAIDRRDPLVAALFGPARRQEVM